MTASTSVAAIVFYLGVAALAGGGIRLARAAIERRGRDRAGIALAACGVVAIGIAIVVFAAGPRETLPF